ncbi:AAA family ATPase [Chitinimonas sp. PSY-7]|uniref:AAA family ATPase n=1 Tax=Chitinimonas sp. PSY-7 TaxID=3459088 RepID=UPI00403FCD6E
MKIIVIASQKGGAGKTTLVAHLAVTAEQEGVGRTVLIDTDPQGSLAAWWNSRKSDTPALASSTLAELPAKLEALSNAGFKLAVIDTPPAITNAIRDVVKLADLVLIPTRPSPHDLRAVGSTVDIVQEAGRPFAFAVTQAKPTAKLTLQAIAALSLHGAVAPAIIHDRVDYAGSMVDGRTVVEVDPKGRSAEEMRQLLAFVLERMNAKTKRKKKETV